LNAAAARLGDEANDREAQRQDQDTAAAPSMDSSVPVVGLEEFTGPMADRLNAAAARLDDEATDREAQRQDRDTAPALDTNAAPALQEITTRPPHGEILEEITEARREPDEVPAASPPALANEGSGTQEGASEAPKTSWLARIFGKGQASSPKKSEDDQPVLQATLADAASTPLRLEDTFTRVAIPNSPGEGRDSSGSESRSLYEVAEDAVAQETKFMYKDVTTEEAKYLQKDKKQAALILAQMRAKGELFAITDVGFTTASSAFEIDSAAAAAQDGNVLQDLHRKVNFKFNVKKFSLAAKKDTDGLNEPLLPDDEAAGAAGGNPMKRDVRQASLIRQHLKKTQGAAQHERPAPSAVQPAAATNEIQEEAPQSPRRFQREFTPDTAGLLASMASPTHTSMSEILQAVPIVRRKEPQQAEGESEALEAGAGDGPLRSPERQAAQDLSLAVPIRQESEAPASPQELQRRPSGNVVRPATLLVEQEEAGGRETALEEEKETVLIKVAAGSSQDEEAMPSPPIPSSQNTATEMRDRSEVQVPQEASAHEAAVPTPGAAALEPAPASQPVNTGAVKAALMQFDAPREASPPRRRGDAPLQQPHPEAPTSAAPDLETSEDTQFYSFEVLSGPPPYPEGVDPARRELHLSDANFLDIFGKSKQEFAAIPAWKRDLIKKKKKLF